MVKLFNRKLAGKRLKDLPRDGRGRPLMFARLTDVPTGQDLIDRLYKSTPQYREGDNGHRDDLRESLLPTISDMFDEHIATQEFYKEYKRVSLEQMATLLRMAIAGYVFTKEAVIGDFTMLPAYMPHWLAGLMDNPHDASDVLEYQEWFSTWTHLGIQQEAERRKAESANKAKE